MSALLKNEISGLKLLDDTGGQAPVEPVDAMQKAEVLPTFANNLNGLSIGANIAVLVRLFLLVLACCSCHAA